MFAQSQNAKAIRLINVITLLILCSDAYSNDPNAPSSRIIPIPYPTTLLLRNASIHQELNLTPSQLVSLDAALDKVERPLFRLRDFPLETIHSSATPLLNQLDKEIAAILTPEQAEKLFQILWRALEMYALQEPELIKRLALNANQTAKINIILQAQYDRFKRLQNAPAQEESDLNDFIQRNKASILGILNARQGQILKQLTGATFDLTTLRYPACKAPPFEPVEAWLNTPNQEIPALKGKVTVIHFYAFGCINCIHNLPYYNAWYHDYPASDFQIIGIHRPETAQEQLLEKVKSKSAEANMRYPIAVDKDSHNWDSWANSIWPSIYLIDKKGFVRYWWYGELNWKGAPTEKLMRAHIKALLEE